MTENNAAQPGEKLLDYAVAIAHERELEVTGHKHDSEGAVRRFKAAVDRALLSKLRAEGVQAGDDVQLPAPDATIETIPYWDAGHMKMYARNAVRAALASTPVADPAPQYAYSDDGRTVTMTNADRAPRYRESAPVAGSTLPLEKALHELVSKIAPGLDTGDLLQDAQRASTMLDTAPVAGEATEDAFDDGWREAANWSGRDDLLADMDSFAYKAARARCVGKLNQLAAPQASEAVCSCPTGDGSLRHPCAVHPPGDKDGGDCAKGSVVPSEPLRVFSAGIWTYDGTGQAFSHTDLDAAAFVTYRAALSPTQPTEQGERDA